MSLCRKWFICLTQITSRKIARETWGLCRGVIISAKAVFYEQKASPNHRTVMGGGGVSVWGGQLPTMEKKIIQGYKTLILPSHSQVPYMLYSLCSWTEWVKHVWEGRIRGLNMKENKFYYLRLLCKNCCFALLCIAAQGFTKTVSSLLEASAPFDPRKSEQSPSVSCRLEKRVAGEEGGWQAPSLSPPVACRSELSWACTALPRDLKAVSATLSSCLTSLWR